MNSSAPDFDAQDAADMQRLMAGRDSALDDLMSRHGTKLFHYLIRQVGNEEDAADLAQETFVRVYKHRERFDPGQRFSTWLYTIATNAARDRLKWRSRRPEVSLQTPIGDGEAELGSVLPDQRRAPDLDLELSEQGRAVRDAIAALPAELREPVLLAEYEGLSAAEIGKILDCTPKAVESRLYRARRQLRETLSQWIPS